MHVIQVVTDSSAVNPTIEQFSIVNDQATRSIIAGSSQQSLVTIAYQDPPRLLIDIDGNADFSPGDRLRYSIDYANNGDTELSGAAIFDDFDEMLL